MHMIDVQIIRPFRTSELGNEGESLGHRLGVKPWIRASAMMSISF